MVVLTMPARREGRNAMEAKLTAAGRVRRKFKAGVPARVPEVSLSPLQALDRLVMEAGRARDLMRDAGLNPENIRCALIHYTPDKDGKVQYRWVPQPGGMGSMMDAR